MTNEKLGLMPSHQVSCASLEEIKEFQEMSGQAKMENRSYALKRFNLRDIYLTKEEAKLVSMALEKNLKVVQLGFFTVVLSTVSAIEPRAEFYLLEEKKHAK